MKFLMFLKKINLKYEYDQIAENIKDTRNRINLLEDKYNYADDNMKDYYSYELILLKEKYSRLICNVKSLDKEIEKLNR
ncbi:MAG: hypothetical protein N2749_05095 [Clostridia bacterium]|nr:hypothetical protein [Clostridia bacterium]